MLGSPNGGMSLSKTSNTLRSTRIHPGADRAYLPPWSSTRPCCAAFGASCSREAYQECDLKELCLGGPNGRAENPVRLPPGRQLQMHYHEEVLQNARAEQRTADQKKALRDKLRPRAKVERKISEVLRLHGLRRGRYFGGQKRDLQALMTATMVNSKRLLTLTDETADLAEALREELAA